jgi:ribonuclease BN (tRNA processing enzyme)
MKVRILGCSGGIGGRHMRTTSMLVDHDLLVDAGTGVGDLSIAELTQIDHLFITHSHLDHVACLPFIVDTVGDIRSKPLQVHATKETLEALRRHIFNWTIWPDFTTIPSKRKPYLLLEPIAVGEKVQVAGRKITALPANHTVPAVGYRVDSGAGSLVFTGDTTTCPELWQAVNKIRNLRYLLIETAFSDREERLAEMSKHLCPRMLADELKQLKRRAEIYITHLKPGQIEQTMQELELVLGDLKPRMLQSNQVFDL